MSLERRAAFRVVLRSSVAFFGAMIAAVVIGLSGGHGYRPPTPHSPWPLFPVFLMGMALPAFSAGCLIVAWVRFSVDDFVWTRRLALMPWIYAGLYAALVVLTRR